MVQADSLDTSSLNLKNLLSKQFNN